MTNTDRAHGTKIALKKIRVLLADGHPIVRSGIRALLERVPDLQVIAEASDGAEALRLIELHQPDVALIESDMSMLDGLDATACVTRTWPDIHIIVISTNNNEAGLRRALEHGATGYLTIAVSPAELEFAVKTVANDKPYVSPSATTLLVDFARGRTADESYERLSPRQREVLKFIAEGNTTKQIAIMLNISAKTVETHRALLAERLDIKTSAGLVRYAIRVGVIRLED